MTTAPLYRLLHQFFGWKEYQPSRFATRDRGNHHITQCDLTTAQTFSLSEIQPLLRTHMPRFLPYFTVYDIGTYTNRKAPFLYVDWGETPSLSSATANLGKRKVLSEAEDFSEDLDRLVQMPRHSVEALQHLNLTRVHQEDLLAFLCFLKRFQDTKTPVGLSLQIEEEAHKQGRRFHVHMNGVRDFRQKDWQRISHVLERGHWKEARETVDPQRRRITISFEPSL
jgi:hypothetical protein